MPRDMLARALEAVGQARTALRRTGRLMCGVPDYDTYVAHVRAHHPDRPVMSYEAFFRNRQDARYGAGGRARCC